MIAAKVSVALRITTHLSVSTAVQQATIAQDNVPGNDLLSYRLSYASLSSGGYSTHPNSASLTFAELGSPPLDLRVMTRNVEFAVRILPRIQPRLVS
jgi:hypothetical protein